MEVYKVAAVSSVTKANSIERVEKEQPMRSNTLSSKEIQDIVRQNKAQEVILSVPEKALATAIQHINKVVSGANVEFHFSVHKPSKSVMVSLVDKDTGDVVLEIPPQNILDAYVKRMELNGLYLDERR